MFSPSHSVTSPILASPYFVYLAKLGDHIITSKILRATLYKHINYNLVSVGLLILIKDNF